MVWHLYARGKAVGAYVANSPIFPTNLVPDLRWGFNGIWNISIIDDTGVGFEYSLDGGTTYFTLGTTVANQELIFNVKADEKDSFNLRPTSGTTVVRILVSIAPEDIQRAKVESGAIPDPLNVNICPVNCDVPIINGSVSPLLVDICPVTCEIDVDINSVSFGNIPVDIAAQTQDPINVNVTNVQGNPIGKIIASETNTAITGNTDIFTATAPVGTSSGDAVVFRVQWSAEDGGVLSYTLNDSDFVSFNDENALKENSSHIFDVIVEDGDLFTLQFEKSTTIIFLRVIQLV